MTIFVVELNLKGNEDIRTEIRNLIAGKWY